MSTVFGASGLPSWRPLRRSSAYRSWSWVTVNRRNGTRPILGSTYRSAICVYRNAVVGRSLAARAGSHLVRM